MKSMSEISMESLWLYVWGLAALVICVITISCCTATVITNRDAFVNGYERGSVVGVSGSFWVKAK